MKKIITLILSGFILIGFMLPSAAVMTVEEAEPICYQVALGVNQIAKLRDAGVPKQELYTFIDEMEVSKEEKQFLKEDVDFVYNNPDINPLDLAGAIYNACMQALTETEI